MSDASQSQKIPRISVDDVGTYWTRDDGSIWRVITYCEHPTVSWERVDGHEELRGKRIGGAVGSEITRGFVRLVAEDA